MRIKFLSLFFHSLNIILSLNFLHWSLCYINYFSISHFNLIATLIGMFFISFIYYLYYFIELKINKYFLTIKRLYKLILLILFSSLYFILFSKFTTVEHYIFICLSNFYFLYIQEYYDEHYPL